MSMAKSECHATAAQTEEGALSVRLLETNRLFLRDGVPMAEARLSFPEFAGEGAGELNRFYGQLRDVCLSYAEGARSELSFARYEAEPLPRRRFLHRRPVLLPSVRIFRWGEFLSLRRELALFYRGRITWRRALGEVLDGRGMLCSPSRLLRLHRPLLKEGGADVGRRVSRKNGSFYLNERGEVVIPEEAHAYYHR